MDTDTIYIYYIHEQFLIFNKQAAIKLRSQRITWQLVGTSPSGLTLPCLISHYAAKICLDLKLATFMGIRTRYPLAHSAHESWLSKLNQIKLKASSDFKNYRIQELTKRGIDATPERIGKFDEDNMRIPIQSEPNDEYSNCVAHRLDDYEIERLLSIDDDKMKVHGNLFERGFYITSGLKFGGDFIAYQGDPIMYHGTFVVRVLPGRDNTIDLERVEYMALNTILRLCHGSNKIPLFAIVDNDGISSKIVYFTLRTKNYIEVTKSNNNFQILEPQSDKRYIFSDGECPEMDHHSKRMKVDI